MKAWSASAVSGGQSTGNVVTQVSSDTESVESSPSAKSRETSPTASPMMPARRLVPASSGDELENEPDPGWLNINSRPTISHSRWAFFLLQKWMPPTWATAPPHDVTACPKQPSRIRSANSKRRPGAANAIRTSISRVLNASRYRMRLLMRNELYNKQLFFVCSPVRARLPQEMSRKSDDSMRPQAPAAQNDHLRRRFESASGRDGHASATSVG